MGTNEILRICILKHERDEIVRDVHEGTIGGNYTGEELCFLYAGRC